MVLSFDVNKLILGIKVMFDIWLKMLILIDYFKLEENFLDKEFVIKFFFFGICCVEIIIFFLIYYFYKVFDNEFREGDLIFFILLM